MAQIHTVPAPRKDTEPTGLAANHPVQNQTIQTATTFAFAARLSNQHTLIVGLKDILPEDLLWRKDNPRVPPLICFEEDHVCQCPFGCIPTLAKRCAHLFGSNRGLQLILVLFNRYESVLTRSEAAVESLRTAPDMLRLHNPPNLTAKVPRLWVLRVDRQFQPKLSRANYDGLQAILRHADHVTVQLPVFD